MNESTKLLIALGVGYLIGQSQKKDSFEQGELYNPYKGYSKDDLLRYKRTKNRIPVQKKLPVAPIEFVDPEPVETMPTIKPPEVFEPTILETQPATISLNENNEPIILY